MGFNKLDLLIIMKHIVYIHPSNVDLMGVNKIDVNRSSLILVPFGSYIDYHLPVSSPIHLTLISI